MIIYKVTNLLNDKVYIGKTVSTLTKRRLNHYSSIKNKSSITNFHNALKKYPKNSFVWEVLDTAETIEELNILEIKYIDKFNSYKSGYNMTTGGDGGITYKKGTELYERTKHKLGNWKNGNPGSTPEAIKKRVETFKNVKWKSGKNHGNYGKSRLDMLGKPSNNSKPVIVNGIEYLSTGVAAKELGLNSSEVVRVRCNSTSKKWKNYYYK